MLPDIVRPSGITKRTQVVFGGFDRRPEARDGTWHDTEHMTAARYPLLAARSPRTVYSEGFQGLALYGFGDVLLSVRDGGYVYYNNWLLCMLAEQDYEHRLIPFGKRVIVPVTRQILNLQYPLKGRVTDSEALPANPGEGDAWAVGAAENFGTVEVWVREGNSWVNKGPVLEDIEAEVTLPAGTAWIHGTYYEGEPAEWNALTIWPNTNNVDFRNLFRVGDAVTISGCTAQPRNNQTIIVREVLQDELRFYENSFRPAMIGVTPIYAGSGGVDFDVDALYRVTGEGFPIDQTGGEDHRYFRMTYDIIEAMSYDPEVTDLMVYWIEKAYDPAGTAGARLLFLKWDPDLEYYVSFGSLTALDSTAIQESETIHDIKLEAKPGIDASPGFPFSTHDGDVPQYYETKAVSIARKWPELDGIFTDSNRLWGWSGNTIYASKLGDPSNFYFFDGTADSAWSVELQTAGAITGGVSVHGYPTFFKEQRRYRVYGSTPESFQLSEQDCYGVLAGCAKAMVVLDGALYYVSRIGVMMDSGSIPQLISQELGEVRLHDAVGCGAGTEVYFTGQDEAGNDQTFIYDTRSGIWLREGSHQIASYATVGGKIFAAEWMGEAGQQRHYLVCYGAGPWNGFAEEAPVLSRVVSNDWTMEEANRKRIHRVQLRFTVGSGATLTISVKYDSTTAWRTVGTITGDGVKQSHYFPVMLRRCDHFALKLEGSGAWQLESLALETRTGSAIH